MTGAALDTDHCKRQRECLFCGLLLWFSMQEIILLLMQAGSTNRSAF